MLHAIGIVELMPHCATQYLMPMSVSSPSSDKELEENFIFGVGGDLDKSSRVDHVGLDAAGLIATASRR